MPVQKGFKRSDETKQRMSEAALRRRSKLTGLYGFTQEFVDEQKAKGLIWCSHCKDFKEGKLYRCLDCRKRINDETYAKEHPDSRKVRRRGIREDHPERSSAMDRKQGLRKMQLTEDEYEAMLIEQGNVCAICGENRYRRRLAVDHDHRCCSTNRGCDKCRRGLLCHPCNLFLARVESGWVFRAFEYLRKWGDLA